MKKIVLFISILVFIGMFQYHRVNNGENNFVIKTQKIQLNQVVEARNVSFEITNIKNIKKVDPEDNKKKYTITLNMNIKNNSTKDIDFFYNFFIVSHLKGPNQTKGIKLQQGNTISLIPGKESVSGEVQFNLPEDRVTNFNKDVTIVYMDKVKGTIIKYTLLAHS